MPRRLLQGTNAHVLLRRLAGNEPGQRPAEPAALPWRSARIHAAPPSFAMLRGLAQARTSGELAFEVTLQAPVLAYLRDHSVLGLPLLPAASLLEAAAAAAATADSTQPTAVAGTLLLADASIPAPVVLGGAEASSLLISVSYASGFIAVRSLQPGTTHLRCSMSAAATAARQPQRVAAGRQLAFIMRSQQPAAARPIQPLGGIAAAQQDSYCSYHPAAIDACLHLGACMSAASGAAVRVPAAVQAFAGSANKQTSAGGAPSASCQLWSTPTASRQALPSFWLRPTDGPASTPAAVAVVGLESRPLQRAPPSTATASAEQRREALEAGEPPMLYKLQWQAAAASVPAVRRPMPRSGIALQLSGPGSSAALQLLQVPAACGDAAAVPVPLCNLLACLQEATARGSGAASFELSTQGAWQASPPLCPGQAGSAAQAAAWGLARVAATEAVAATWAAVDSCSLAAADHAKPPVASGAGALAGTCMQQGYALQSTLVAATAGQAPAALQPAALAGLVLVTGGLGGEDCARSDVRSFCSMPSPCTCISQPLLSHGCPAGIGTLLGAWLAQHAGVQPALLGRSGRFAAAQPTPRSRQQLLLSEALVTAARCDVAAAEEAAAALAGSGCGQLAAVVHAGGVLQDASLPHQTASGLRAVCGPKVPFAARASQAAALQAVRAVGLFSSVAAFVGTAGQANYAATNSALDRCAETLQGHGLPGKESGAMQRGHVISCFPMQPAPAWNTAMTCTPTPRHLLQAPASSGAHGRASAWRTPAPLCWRARSSRAWGL